MRSELDRVLLHGITSAMPKKRQITWWNPIACDRCWVRSQLPFVTPINRWQSLHSQYYLRTEPLSDRHSLIMRTALPYIVFVIKKSRGIVMRSIRRRDSFRRTAPHCINIVADNPRLPRSGKKLGKGAVSSLVGAESLDKRLLVKGGYVRSTGHKRRSLHHDRPFMGQKYTLTRRQGPEVAGHARLPECFGQVGKAANLRTDCHCSLLGGLQDCDRFAHGRMFSV